MSVYKVIDIVGTSPDSWEDAAKSALSTAAKSLRDLRVAEVTKLDMTLTCLLRSYLDPALSSS